MLLLILPLLTSWAVWCCLQAPANRHRSGRYAQSYADVRRSDLHRYSSTWGCRPCGAVRQPCHVRARRYDQGPDWILSCRSVDQRHTGSLINFEVWVPSAWNGKLVVTGNGGYGNVPSYRDMAWALRQGYASAGGDTGHQTATPDDLLWGVGHPARIEDWGSRSIHAITHPARLIARTLTDRMPTRAYFYGCSTGGQQAYAQMQRYPEDFDGMVAGAPGNNRIRLNAGFLWQFLVNRERGVNDALILPAAKLPLWRNKVDTQVLKKDCEVSGFPRIYTEHAGAGESTGGSNPRHVLEIHPATRITCGPNDMNFVPFFRAFPGLRHIKPESAHTCLTGLRMWARYHNEDGEDQYEFFQKRPGSCGNFAIVEVFSVPKEWIQATGGGHTAIARVTANGGDVVTLKLYAVEGTPANDWFARLKKGEQLMDDPRLLHGVLTYDYFAMVRAIGEKAGELAKPDDWKKIDFPLAFVILGPTSVVPWEE